jgi:hypothetical protein
MGTLKDVLLVFTVVLLVYVLYQRLLQVLGKKERSKKYARVGEELELQNGVLKMTMEVAQPMELLLSVHKPSGETVVTLEERTLSEGSHTVEVIVSSLSPGRYYLQLKTPAEVYSRYFEMN